MRFVFTARSIVIWHVQVTLLIVVSENVPEAKDRWIKLLYRVITFTFYKYICHILPDANGMRQGQ